MKGVRTLEQKVNFTKVMEDLQQDIFDLGEITVWGIYHLEGAEKVFTDYELLEEDPRIAHLNPFHEDVENRLSLLPGEKKTKIAAKKLLEIMEDEAIHA